jgi:hypothetical protein
MPLFSAGFITLLWAAPGFAQTTPHVDYDAPSGNDETIWPMAFRFLNDALEGAVHGDQAHVGSCVQADVMTDTVFVGKPVDAGEVSDTGASGHGPNRICGAVEYTYAIGNPCYRTEVGTDENSNRSYGTFSQGGNVYESIQSDAVSHDSLETT